MMPSKINSSTRFTLSLLRAMLIFVLCSLASIAFADKKEKAPQTAQKKTETAKPTIDTSQLV